MMMPSTAVRICAIFAFLMCVDTHSAYARDPPAAAMTTTSAPNNARNSSSAPLPAICSAIICGTMVNESTSGSTPTPLSENW